MTHFLRKWNAGVKCCMPQKYDVLDKTREITAEVVVIGVVVVGVLCGDGIVVGCSAVMTRGVMMPIVVM